MTAQERERRNIGIVAHINAGKTTLTERILFDSGKQRFMGEVDEGTATMDFLDEEQDRGISISAAVTTVGWRHCDLNLVDMPGHVDFTAEVERCLRVLDGAIVLIDGVRGVESQTEMVWNHAVSRGLARIIFVNKMDRPGADFAAAVAAVAERLHCRAVPVTVPLRADGELVGSLDVVTGSIVPWRDAAVSTGPQLAAARSELLEAAADFDDSILADFVEGRNVDAARLRAGLRRGVLAGQIVPVLGGAALHNLGVQALLDAVCDYLPAPADLAPVASIDAGGGSRRPMKTEPFCAFVFKTIREEADLPLHFVRVYSGSLEPGQMICSSGSAEPFAVVALWRIHADHRQPIDRVDAGDIVAIQTPAALSTGDTLFAPEAPMRLEPVRFSKPVLAMTIEAASEAEGAAVEAAARWLAEDDPTLALERDPETGSLTVAGMGELHLEVFGSRLRRRVGNVRFGRPMVAFLQTVQRPGRAAAECRTPRPDGGLRSAWVEIEVMPEPGQAAASIEDAGRGPPAMRAVLLAALADRARTGLAEPFAAAGLRLRLLDIAGDAGDGDSATLLFLEALDVACRKAVAAAGATLLEPLVSIEVFAPNDVLSGVIADLKARRARIGEIVAATVGVSRVRGLVALQEMLGYLTRLRSLTRGLGTVQMAPAGYARQGGAEADRGAAQKGQVGLDPGGGDQ